MEFGQNNDDARVEVVAIDRQFWVGKTKVTVADMEKANNDLLSFQDGVNRSLRHINRLVKANYDAINRAAAEVNTNLQTCKNLDEAEKLDRLRLALDDVPRDLVRPCFNGLIRVVCFYAGQAKEIGTEVSALNLPNVMVTTVDGCQGHEAEFVFVVTTKAGLSSNDNSGAFWNDERRVNVALSRSKFGMMVVGDLKLLWTADGIWRRFLRRALDKAIAVTPEYIHAMMDPKPQFVDGVIATTNGSVKAFDFYDDWQGSDGPSLPRSIRPPRMLFAGISRQQQSARQPGSAHPNVPAGLCHYCLRPGHYYRNCPDRPSPSPNMPRPTSSRPDQWTNRTRDGRGRRND
ncbi:hypothetical protein niasHT_031299 [Heterodera trifolii]|uniref:CCHC-type domain-containing protein n=2 Tax=Heterodera trifolii TaxID=157864 RepID=A0ABD2I7F1_9BILA